MESVFQTQTSSEILLNETTKPEHKIKPKKRKKNRKEEERKAIKDKKLRETTLKKPLQELNQQGLEMAFGGTDQMKKDDMLNFLQKRGCKPEADV